jgi:hypothetical protein
MDPSTWVIPEENKIPHKQEFASIDSTGSGLIAGRLRKLPYLDVINC